MKASIFKIIVLAFILDMVMVCITAFVAKDFWEWFIVPSFDLNVLSYSSVIGILLFLKVITLKNPTINDTEEDSLDAGIKIISIAISKVLLLAVLYGAGNILSSY